MFSCLPWIFHHLCHLLSILYRNVQRSSWKKSFRFWITVCIWYIQKCNIMAKVFATWDKCVLLRRVCDILNAVLHFAREARHFAFCVEQLLDLCVKFWVSIWKKQKTVISSKKIFIRPTWLRSLPTSRCHRTPFLDHRLNVTNVLDGCLRWYIMIIILFTYRISLDSWKVNRHIL